MKAPDKNPINANQDIFFKYQKKSTIYIYAPVVRGRKGEYRKDILSYKRRGFRKIKIDNVLLFLFKFNIL